jgi:hypothetical protein
MSYSKDLSRYPEEFGLVVEKGALEGFTVPFPSEEEARRFSGRFYAYLGALKRAFQAPDATEEIRQLYAYGQKIQLRQVGREVLVQPLDQDKDAKLLRELLGQGGGSPPPAAGDMTKGGQILVPINPAHLPPWLAEMATKRAEKNKP